MFEVQRLSKFFQSHDSNTMKMLQDIKVGDKRAALLKDATRGDVNNSGTTYEQHTPPTKDTDFVFSSKEGEIIQ